MMKMQLGSLFVLSAVMLCACCVSVPGPVAAEEVSYFFDFNDEKMPDDLLIMPFKYDSYANPRWAVSGGELRIYDTTAAGGGVVISPFTGAPDTFITDTHSSAVFNSTGGPLGGIPILIARATGAEGDPTADWYEFYVLPSVTNASLVQIGLLKVIDYAHVDRNVGSTFELIGPCVLEFDVTDGKTPEGLEYTDLVGRVIYADGQQTRSLSMRDWGTLGGHPRLLSGAASFGASVTGGLADAGWVLNETIEDVTIRGTLVPEPCVLLLLVMGVMALAGWRTQ